MEIDVDGKKYNIKCEHAMYDFIFKAYDENNVLAAFNTATLIGKFTPDNFEELLVAQVEKLKVLIHDKQGK